MLASCGFSTGLKPSLATVTAFPDVGRWKVVGAPPWRRARCRQVEGSCCPTVTAFQMSAGGG